MRRLLLIALLAAINAATPARAQLPADGAMKIYSSLPHQGVFKVQTRDVIRGMRMALRDHGGTAGGRVIRYVPLDDASRRTGSWQPSRVAANARRVARDDAAVVYLGNFNSGASSIAIPILNEAGVPAISPSNTYVGLTRAEGAEPAEPDKYYPSGERTYARVVPADHTQAAAVVAYARALGVTRLAVASDDEVYGKGMARMVVDRAPAFGLTAVSVGTVRPRRGRPSIDRVARAAARSGADGFFYGGITQTRAVEVFSAVGRRLMTARLLGTDGVAEFAFTSRLARRYARRTFITNPTLRPTDYPAEGRRFFRRFRQRYGVQPEPYAIYGYEAMALALDAIDRAGAGSREAIVDALMSTRDRDSVLGTYSIDAFGDTTLPSYGGLRIDRHGHLVFDRVITAAPWAARADGPQSSRSLSRRASRTARSNCSTIRSICASVVT